MQEKADLNVSPRVDEADRKQRYVSDALREFLKACQLTDASGGSLCGAGRRKRDG